MLGKLSMVSAVALIALTSSISIGMAEPHPWGWRLGVTAAGVTAAGVTTTGELVITGYGYVPYLGPRCYVTVYGNTVWIDRSPAGRTNTRQPAAFRDGTLVA